MSAATALRLAQAANVSVTLDGNDLLLEADYAPPPEILEMISRYKTDVIALLRPAQDGWSIEDWQAFFDERAGIAEYDDGLSRQEAEALASEHCVVEWLMRHPVRSRPGFCLGCGRVEDERGSRAALRHGTNGHAWLHFECWPVWHAQRRTEAIGALRAMNISARDTPYRR